MKHALTQMQDRFAVIYETLSNSKGNFPNYDEYKSSFLVISEVNHGLNCEKHPALDRYSQGLIESQNAVKFVQCTVYLIILFKHSE